MPDIVISDTSCFILLDNIGELDLLRKMYSQIVTTQEVADEFRQSLPDWVEIRTPIERYRQQVLELQLDRGEASAIALAIELPQSLLILDDYRARRMAALLGMRMTGTIGVIVKAKLRGVIISVKPILTKMRKTDFRLTDELEKEALKEAGEE